MPLSPWSICTVTDAFFRNASTGTGTDDGRQRFIGPGLVVLAKTVTEPRAEEIDQVREGPEAAL